ncbi:MAG TPA: hypothetical protein VE971_03675, partial [Candidatus Eisenbacteria bacterium]|nr:hypothetical protein [Candidatus Eisenbacteria bacterium]
ITVFQSETDDAHSTTVPFVMWSHCHMGALTISLLWMVAAIFRMLYMFLPLQRYSATTVYIDK